MKGLIRCYSSRFLAGETIYSFLADSSSAPFITGEFYSTVVVSVLCWFSPLSLSSSLFSPLILSHSLITLSLSTFFRFSLLSVSLFCSPFVYLSPTPCSSPPFSLSLFMSVLISTYLRRFPSLFFSHTLLSIFVSLFFSLSNSSLFLSAPLSHTSLSALNVPFFSSAVFLSNRWRAMIQREKWSNEQGRKDICRGTFWHSASDRREKEERRF